MPRRETSPTNGHSAFSNRLLFVTISGSALILLSDDVGRSELVLCKPPILSTNTR